MNKAFCHTFVLFCKHIRESYDIFKALAFGHFLEIYSNHKLKILQNSCLLITSPLINFNPVYKQLLNKSALSNSCLPLHEYSLWNDPLLVYFEQVTVMLQFRPCCSSWDSFLFHPGQSSVDLVNVNNRFLTPNRGGHSCCFLVMIF